MSKVLIIGAGAAGSMAAITAAKRGHEVLVFEKNEKTGKKIYITGKGRCNLTNAVDNEELMKNMVRNPKFLYSSFSSFKSDDCIRFFEDLGCPTKVERGDRVFPVSDHSSDVIKALDKGMRESGVRVEYRANVEEVLLDEEGKKFNAVKLQDGRIIKGDSIIIATGGLSYRSTGSTGDGFRFAREMGHTVTDLRPSLVALNLSESFLRELEGLSLKNIRVKVKNGKKTIFDELGEMVFTRHGVSGPLILSASSIAGDSLSKGGIISIDLKPALSEEELETRLNRDFSEFRLKAFKNSFDKLLPKSFIPIFVMKTGISAEKKVSELSKADYRVVRGLLKDFPLKVTGLRGYEEAVITRGGVSVKEIEPKTMASKKVQGVYFAGEVMDVDALTGGYNLQIAWSTGFVAGNSV